MDTLFAQLKKLYDNELYDQVQPIVSKLELCVRLNNKEPAFFVSIKANVIQISTLAFFVSLNAFLFSGSDN